jgi:threonine dehydratase
MKEPTKIKLTDNPENKKVKLTPLPSTQYYDVEMSDDVWIKNEDNKQNNSQSIQQLESDKTN